MLKNIFATISLVLVFLGLVSCTVDQPSPPAIERPTIDSPPSPTDTDLDEDEEDEQNEDDNEDQNTNPENKS